MGISAERGRKGALVELFPNGWWPYLAGGLLVVLACFIGLASALFYVGWGISNGHWMLCLYGSAFFLVYLMVIVGFEAFLASLNHRIGVLFLASFLAIAASWGLMSWTYIGAALGTSGAAAFVGTWLLAVSRLGVARVQPS